MLSTNLWKIYKKTLGYPQIGRKTETCPCSGTGLTADFTQAFEAGKSLIWMEKQGFSTQIRAFYYCY
jgi:hypothetical protein